MSRNEDPTSPSTSLPNETFWVFEPTSRLSEPVPYGGLAGPSRRKAVAVPVVLRLIRPQLASAAGPGEGCSVVPGAPSSPLAPGAPGAPASPFAPAGPGTAARRIACCVPLVMRSTEIVPFLMSLFWIVPSLIFADVISDPA